MTMLDVTTPLPELEREVRLVDMVAYAGATWDWHRLHYDADFVRAQDLDAPIIDGQMFGALLAEHVIDAFGPSTHVTAMRFRFSSMATAGEVMIVRGAVVDVSEDTPRRVVVEQDLVTSTGRVVIEKARTEAVVHDDA